jgi:hypothetical protein
MLQPVSEAFRYAARGWPVFACEVGGKRPHAKLSPQGFKDATTDADRIAATWKQEPKANIGIACGPVIVLDIDCKPNEDPEKNKRGDRELVDLIRDNGPIGWTLQAWTPSGGTHFYFEPPEGERITRTIGRFAPAIDVLGHGGYVVAPPSMIEGIEEPYAWCDDGASLTRPSAWVEAKMRMSAKSEPSKEANIRGRWRSATADIAIRAVRYVDTMPIAIAGSGGHDALFKVACVVIRGFDLPDVMAIEILRHYSAKCDPPWSERELEHKIAQARKMASGAPGYLIKDRP